MKKELEKWRLNARKFKTSSLLSSSKIKVQLAKIESRSSVEQVNLIQSEIGKLIIYIVNSNNFNVEIVISNNFNVYFRTSVRRNNGTGDWTN